MKKGKLMIPNRD